MHTVGPNRHRGQDDPALLASCVTRSLALALGLGARGVALPAVGAGAYGWPAPEAARTLVGAVADVAARPGLEVVRFVLTTERMHEAFSSELDAGH